MLSAPSYLPFAANPSVREQASGHPALHIKGDTMHAPANQPDFKAAADPTIEELNRIVEQAETLLRTLGEETGDAAEAVRERVTQTLNQARARLATTAAGAEEVAQSLADRADDYVRKNPWQAVAVAALLGGVVTYLIAKAGKRK